MGRLDRLEGVPWWARYHRGRGIVAQCTCDGCPTNEPDAVTKITQTVEEGLWDNGQIMLVDIARREGLKYGPNRKMQELMAQRNDRILSAIHSNMSSAQVGNRIDRINFQYHNMI